MGPRSLDPSAKRLYPCSGESSLTFLCSRSNASGVKDKKKGRRCASTPTSIYVPASQSRQPCRCSGLAGLRRTMIAPSSTTTRESTGARFAPSPALYALGFGFTRRCILQDSSTTHSSRCGCYRCGQVGEAERSRGRSSSKRQQHDGHVVEPGDERHRWYGKQCVEFQPPGQCNRESGPVRCWLVARCLVWRQNLSGLNT